MMTFTQAIRATEHLARDFAETDAIVTPMDRADMSCVVWNLIGDQTGAYQSCCATFERIWIDAGGTFG